MVVVGVCDLWPQEEKSEKLDQQVGQQYNRGVNNSMEIEANRSMNRVREESFILTGKELSINAYQTNPTKETPPATISIKN